jgi:hypothetical protein
LFGEDKKLSELTIGKMGVEEVGDKKTLYLYVMNEDDNWIFTVDGNMLIKFVLNIEDLKYDENTELTGEGS